MKVVQKHVNPKTINKNLSPVHIKRGMVMLELKDVKTGKIEKVFEHNMQTNAIDEMVANCGWMNTDNLDKSNLAEQLLGGVMLFDDDIDEDADIVYVPEGLVMVANGAVGTVNNSNPTELGSYSSTESGWRDANTYVTVFDWTSSQGNGTIASICAANKEFGYGGTGNVTSGEVASRTTLSLTGTNTLYTIHGVPCNVSLDDSSCYAVDFANYANQKATIRKYRLPINKFAINGTVASPVVIDETEINIPSGLASLAASFATDSDIQNALYNDCFLHPVGSKLMVMNHPTAYSDVWGTSYTQKLWEIDPVTGTVTESTLSNTSGESLKGVCMPMWLDESTVAWIDGYIGSGYDTMVDATKVYSMRRASGTWGNIQSCANPEGISTMYQASSGYPKRIQSNKGSLTLPNGKAFVCCQYVCAFDFVKNTIVRTNNSVAQSTARFDTDHPLVSWIHGVDNTRYGIVLIRNQNCISTIYNLAEPVTKTAEKTMKLTYVFEFDNTEGTTTP